MTFRAITHFLSSRKPLPLRRAYWRGVGRWVACYLHPLATFWPVSAAQLRIRHPHRPDCLHGTELAIAQGIQKTLVPVIDSRAGSVEVYEVSIPSAEVGGGLVDPVPLSDGSVFAYVADVSGHGLAAGILMGAIKTAVRTQLVDFPTPTAVFERLNEVLATVKEPQMYTTCTALRIQPVRNDSVCRVDYAIAGQPACYWSPGMGRSAAGGYRSVR